VSDEYPSAQVLGIDLSPIQPAWVPPNVKFMVDDAESPWMTKEDFYDLVHGRHITPAIKDRTLKLANRWASKHASLFAPDTFQFTHYTRQKHFNRAQPVIIDQETVMPNKASGYLGITMDGELNWNLHIQEVKTKATKSIGALASLAVTMDLTRIWFFPGCGFSSFILLSVEWGKFTGTEMKRKRD
jgi:hypothetical protein